MILGRGRGFFVTFDSSTNCIVQVTLEKYKVIIKDYKPFSFVGVHLWIFYL